MASQTIQFNSILLFYLDITYNNLILIYNVVQTRDDETNNIFCTTKHTCLDTLLRVITDFVNLSLSTATFPDNCKEAILISLIKRSYWILKS